MCKLVVDIGILTMAVVLDCWVYSGQIKSAAFVRILNADCEVISSLLKDMKFKEPGKL